MVDELHALLKYAAILGLAPASSEPRRQRLQQIFTVLIASFYLTIMIYGIVLALLHHRLILLHVVNVLLFVTTMNGWTVIMLESLLTYGQHLAFYEKSRRICARFAQPPLQVAISRYTLRRQQVRQAAIYVIVMCIFNVAKISIIEYHNYHHQDHNAQHFRYYYLLKLPISFVLRLRCLQITLYAGYMVQYMRLFNAQLRALLTTVVSRRCGQDRLSLNLSSTLDRLVALKQLHKEIYELCELFNQLFGWSSVFLVTLILFSLIVSAYGTFHVPFRFEPKYIVVTLLSTIPKIIMICMLCVNGEQLIVQQREAIGHVQRLIGSSTAFNNHQARQYHDLNAEFALQLMQMRIQYNGKQYYTFNMKMLMELGVALISYLVILLQFCTVDTNE